MPGSGPQPRSQHLKTRARVIVRHSRSTSDRFRHAALLRHLLGRAARHPTAPTEADDGDRIDQLINALHEVQLEVARMENQEAIIDGFGVMSGRVKGPATGHSS